MKDFISNAWYVLAWSEEVTDQLLARKLLGKAMVLTRDANGEAVVIRDRCPHRFAPLSMGSLDGDLIVCRYHGLTFNRQGVCVRNPYSDRIPESARLDIFPTVERYGMIWVWTGERDLADPDRIPDFSITEGGEGYSRITGYTKLFADYQYGTDNLLDLSHIEFLHTGTFAGNGVIFAGEHSVIQEGDRLYSNWWMPGVPCPTALDQMLGLETIDHWFDMRWDAPANMLLQIGGTAPGGLKEEGATLEQAHLLTPADVGETHYFWSNTMNFVMPPEHEAAFQKLLNDAFGVEDKPMIEASYANTDGDFWDQKPVSLGIDKGGALARRIVENIKTAEMA